jgi:hypothetical protein
MSIPGFVAILTSFYTLTLAIALFAIPAGDGNGNAFTRQMWRLILEPQSYDAMTSGLVEREVTDPAEPVIRPRRFGTSWRWPRLTRRSVVYRPRHSY